MNYVMQTMSKAATVIYEPIFSCLSSVYQDQIDLSAATTETALKYLGQLSCAICVSVDEKERYNRFVDCVNDSVDIQIPWQIVGAIVIPVVYAIGICFCMRYRRLRPHL